MSEPLLRVEHLKKYFKSARGMVHAVDDVSFTLDAGKTLGVPGAHHHPPAGAYLRQRLL